MSPWNLLWIVPAVAYLAFLAGRAYEAVRLRQSAQEIEAFIPEAPERDPK